MFENIDLSVKLDKDEYKKLMPQLSVRIGQLQRTARDMNIPIIIVFEGIEAAGKSTLINNLILSLDPRGFSVQSINPPNEEEKLRPFLWRFWTKIPTYGRIVFFNRSWYRRVLVERVNKLVKKEEWENAYKEISSFERQLVDDGYVLVKFWLHIDKKEQKKRFTKLSKNTATSWRVTKEDWESNKKYGKYITAAEEMIQKTGTSSAPWTIIEATDERFATVKIYKNVIQEIENKISEKKRLGKTKQNIHIKPELKIDKIPSALDNTDLSKSLTKEEYAEMLPKYQKRIREIEHELYLKRIPLIIMYEGWDAAGKGGNIRRLAQNLDPRGYEVVPISAPNDVEKAHHYLWRFWNFIPKAGHITIFDRTWYGRVLVEKIEGFCTEQEWMRAYQEINEVEEHLTNFGTIIIKFWLHIDKKEQLKRFRARQSDSNKKWKISEEDYRNREKWNSYKKAVDEMIFRTSTTYAPWTVVESDSKYYARIKTLKTIIEAVEKNLEK